MLSRRIFGKTVAALGVGAALGGGSSIGAGMPAQPPTTPYPWPSSNPTEAVQAAQAPLMEWDAARKLALQVPEVLEAVKQEAWDQNRIVTSVDPDLMVLKALSPMAKLTIQRQRNVERHMNNILRVSDNGLNVEKIIYEFMYGKRKPNA
jgi:hypothetical protein